MANIVTERGLEQVRNLGTLRSRGIPGGCEKARQRAFTTSFSSWSTIPASRYLSGFSALSGCSDAHVVFSFRYGWYEYLVPALVLLRALFPLIPDALEYAFTPRALESLCVPVERNGHWTVVMPDFKGVYKARFRRSTVEALTWASLFPSARKTWQSAFKGAITGQMRLELPQATVRVLAYGIRRDKVVHVTSLAVNALLAHEMPFGFVGDASPSFVMNTNAAPLAPNLNAYYEHHDADAECTALCLTESEWQRVNSFCVRDSAPRGRSGRDDERDIANGLVIRGATALPWGEIPTPIAGDALARHWATWRTDGRLARMLEVLRHTRPSAEYLQTDEQDAGLAKS